MIILTMQVGCPKLGKSWLRNICTIPYHKQCPHSEEEDSAATICGFSDGFHDSIEVSCLLQTTHFSCIANGTTTKQLRFDKTILKKYSFENTELWTCQYPKKVKKNFKMFSYIIFHIISYILYKLSYHISSILRILVCVVPWFRDPSVTK